MDLSQKNNSFLNNDTKLKLDNIRIRRVIEVNYNFNEMPAKMRLKQQFLKRYKEKL